MITVLLLSAGWSPTRLPAMASLPVDRLGYRAAIPIHAKAAPPERPEQPVYQASISKGAICEFHDPKHGAGKTVPILGVCESSHMKAKGGEVLVIVDATGKKHTVSAKAVHITLPVCTPNTQPPSK